MARRVRGKGCFPKLTSAPSRSHSCRDLLDVSLTPSRSYHHSQHSSLSSGTSPSEASVSPPEPMQPPVRRSPKRAAVNLSSFPPFARRTAQPHVPFSFELVHQSKKSGARVGVIHTTHGDIHTPEAFVPVATNGVLKHVDFSTSLRARTQLTFSNTYHLIIHPGPDVIEKAGGIHEFVGNPGPIITDSGGFQIFSLANTAPQDELKGRMAKQQVSTVLKVAEEGVKFRSYVDGTLIHLTPESSVQAQKKIGADIILPLDILLPHNVSETELLTAFDRTHRWESRSVREHAMNPKGQAMYAINHGGTDVALRIRSLEFLSKLPFDGLAIGGSLGRNKEEMRALLQNLGERRSIPKHWPIHLLGIADPTNVEECVAYGIDTFDSCYPTKVARHGGIMHPEGTLKISRTAYKDQVDVRATSLAESPLYNYSLATIHHLFKCNEPLYLSIASAHNILYMNKLFETIRGKIVNNEI